MSLHLCRAPKISAIPGSAGWWGAESQQRLLPASPMLLNSLKWLNLGNTVILVWLCTQRDPGGILQCQQQSCYPGCVFYTPFSVPWKDEPISSATGSAREIGSFIKSNPLQRRRNKAVQQPFCKGWNMLAQAQGSTRELPFLGCFWILVGSNL